MRTTWVKMKPLSDWPKDHVPGDEDVEMIKAVKIRCSPSPKHGPSFGSCGFPTFFVLQYRTQEGMVEEANPGAAVCGHVAEID
jgi:hypothetical protein